MSDDFEVIPTNGNIDGKGYSDFIKDYWHFLLGSNPDNPVYQDTTIFTRGCQNYRDVNSSENVRRKNFCGILEETPSIIHTVGSQNNPFRIRSNLSVFVTVLDTIALEPEIDENGREVTQDEVLRRENDAVRPQDVQLTIRKKGGGSQSVSNLFNDHRTSANFSLVIPRTSVLAERLEREIKVDTTYPNAKAEGYYALIKFNTPEVYNIKSDGYGVRGYISKADYHIEIPKEPK
jgi:hypothetical protein